MKFLLSFLLWFAPLIALQATNNSFWSHMRLQGAFCIKGDSYKVHTSGMHPGRQNGEIEVDDGASADRVLSYLIRWYHAPSIHFEKDNDGTRADNTKGIFGFKGKGMTLAAQFLASMDLQQFRIGVGAGMSCSFLQEMIGGWVSNNLSTGSSGKSETDSPLSYIPARSYYFTWSPLLRLGFKLIENQNYTLLIDGTWAPCIYNFSELGSSYYWIYGRNFDLGGTWEKQLSNYVHWSLRVAYGFCINNELVKAQPKHEDPDDRSPKQHKPERLLSISHYIGNITAQVGISIRIPGLSKCSIEGCSIKIDHQHGGKQYRGGGLFTSR